MASKCEILVLRFLRFLRFEEIQQGVSRSPEECTARAVPRTAFSFVLSLSMISVCLCVFSSVFQVFQCSADFGYHFSKFSKLFKFSKILHKILVPKYYLQNVGKL